MERIVNNIEFKDKPKSLIILNDMAIQIDRVNNILLSYDIVNSYNIDVGSEGILLEIESKFALKIQKRFEIDIRDYGVTILDNIIMTGT